MAVAMAMIVAVIVAVAVAIAIGGMRMTVRITRSRRFLVRIVIYPQLVHPLGSDPVRCDFEKKDKVDCAEGTCRCEILQRQHALAV